MPSFVRPVVLVLAALSLAACGSVHPGDAAVVDGHAISMQEAGDASEAYCALAVLSASQQGVTEVPAVDSRRQAVQTLVTLEVARDLAEERNLVPDASNYTLGASARKQLAALFQDSDLDDDTLDGIYAAVQDNQELTVIATALGERATGSTADDQNSDAVMTAGLQEINEAIADRDVDIDPRFDLTLPADAEVTPGTGSLSVAEAPADDAAEDGAVEGEPSAVPVAQLCS